MRDYAKFSVGNSNDLVFFKPFSDSTQLPTIATDGSAGLDLYYPGPDVDILPGNRALLPMGFSMEMPHNIHALVQPRSGLALKHGITVLNTPGLIDCDYRGEVGVILANLGQDTFTVKTGDRVAQLVFAYTCRPNIGVRDSLSESTRGEGGFGSTGT